MKQCASITYKQGIYELPHDFTNDIRLRILKNYEISGKCLNFIERYPSVLPSSQNENFGYSYQKALKK